MRTILLKRIMLEGFYGQNRTVDFSPTETVIRGDVKLGKTTIINAFMWCMLGCDLESRANYMLYDQSMEYSRDFAGQARVEVTLTIDGRNCTIMRTAKQKWMQSRATDEWVKASSDEYKYYIDDLELTKGEFDAWIEKNICPLRYLALVANIDQWRKHGWRTLREMFQSLVGEIKPEDFKKDYKEVLPIINEVGIERARQEFMTRAGKYAKLLGKLAIEEETTKRGLINSEEIDAAEVRIAEINAEIDELDRKQSAIDSENSTMIAKRDALTKDIVVLERRFQKEKDTYIDKHNAQMRKLRDAYNEAVEINKRNKTLRSNAESGIALAKQRLSDLELQLSTLRIRYKESNSKLFNGLCPVCGNQLQGGAAQEKAEEFKKQKDAILMELKKQGDYVNSQIKMCRTDIAQHEANRALKDVDELTALEAYKNEDELHVSYEETERGKQLLQEIEDLQNQMPQPTWAADVDELLRRKGELRLELQRQHELYGQKASNEMTLARLDGINMERKATVAAQCANARAQNLVLEYERELSEIIRFRANSLFPDRTEVLMSKYKKNGEIDFDVCQIEINGKDATATNTADRMNAGIDVSTVFMRFYDINFPLFVDGAESNTDIETYGRQLIKTVVDEECKTLKIEAK